MSKAVLATVKDIKKALTKNVDDDETSEETLKDLLDRLEECDMTLDILGESLIGTVVSKLKGHQQVGAQAKALLKKWKKIAKASTSSNDNKGNGSSKKAERRSSTASTDVAETQSEWDDLPSQRRTICQKFHQFMGIHKSYLVKSGINKEAVKHLLVSRSSEVEAALDAKFSNDRRGYAEKARSLCFNLKKNKELSESVILGQIEPKILIGMTSEQLASAEAKKEREATAKKVNDSKRLDWDQANEDKINEMCGIKGDLLSASLFTCGRCKSVKTTSTQKQTRSADEPMTVFVLCLNCGNRWKC